MITTSHHHHQKKKERKKERKKETCHHHCHSARVVDALYLLARAMFVIKGTVGRVLNELVI